MFAPVKPQVRLMSDIDGSIFVKELPFGNKITTIIWSRSQIFDTETVANFKPSLLTLDQT